MTKTIFELRSYKEYLRSKAGPPGTKTGVKSKLARAMNCQPTYLSQVLHGNAHLSLEQSEKVNGFFEHTKDEARFFILMVQKERAGTNSLKSFFQEQLEEILTRRLVFTQRLGEKQTLSREGQSVYYSSWAYAAVHIALTIPELQNRETISDYLNLPLKRVSEVLDFLVSIGLATQDQGNYKPGTTHIRLGNDSHNIIKHHTNWRNQAMESLDREQVTDLHYSGVVSLAKGDVIRIKNLLLESIRETQKIVHDSKEEDLCAINLDLFSLKK